MTRSKAMKSKWSKENEEPNVSKAKCIIVLTPCDLEGEMEKSKKKLTGKIAFDKIVELLDEIISLQSLPKFVIIHSR